MLTRSRRLRRQIKKNIGDSRFTSLSARGQPRKESLKDGKETRGGILSETRGHPRERRGAKKRPKRMARSAWGRKRLPFDRK
ncbi:hypothetical protein PUN28_000690 [Cardiocondyla obscurior]|uniref:Uncharacterized protein n=1 Tax=Cardiocondyla obscurior TaxID=286306 RepID=A0AAW2H0J3_9HYME